MYVEKFEADTLDEALKAIKTKLGPDAIILKTKTNKGLSGTFAKSKYEITAAISERTYEKKAKVDHVFNEEQRDKFYQAPSSQISQMIDNYNASSESKSSSQNSTANKIGGYGKMGLNKVVQKAEQVKSGLDDFLGARPQGPQTQRSSQQSAGSGSIERPAPQVQSTPATVAKSFETQTAQIASQGNQGYEKEIMAQQKKIDSLEAKLFELTKNVQLQDKSEPIGIANFRSSLKSLEINEAIIRDIVRDAHHNLSDGQLDEENPVFDFGLQALADLIEIDLPLFSKTEDEPIITVLISNGTSGQTSMTYKLASLVEKAAVVQFGEANKDYKMAKNVFDLKYQRTNNLSELVSIVRNFHKEGRKVFVDYKSLGTDEDDTKRFIQGLRRGFKDVEVLTCLSAINSELYNKKQINFHRDFCDGLVVTNLDLCLNFGSLINIQYFNKNLPFKFFGNGRVIPDDVESASKERILDGLFKFGEMN